MPDRLQRYRAKRDFSLTAEPSGAKKPGQRKGRELRYLIQKHDATREHYDFRLEHDGVLLSWACPKGPSLDPHDKRLAVHVEDHPVDYGDFEGTIPKGQYGGGTVMLWDRGTWEPHADDVDAALKAGKLAFALHGERCKGNWALVKLRARRPGDRGKDNWLLIKEHDGEVREGGTPLTEAYTTSVKTGRTMDEIARGGDVWQSNRSDPPAAKAKAARGTKAAAKKKSGGKAVRKGAGKVPAFVEPQLATLVDAPPKGDEWLHEIKYDGYRALASIGGGNVVIRTRGGLDWTDKFSPLVEPLRALPCDSALLDGEIAVADADGRTNFTALKEALTARSNNLIYYVFDLLFLDGEDLRRRPLVERKERLAALFRDAPENGPLVYSGHVRGEGDKVFREAGKLGLEGIVSKRADDPYVSGRSGRWLKVKTEMEQEFVIVGWRPSDKAGRPFSSILLAVRDHGKLRYCGRVGTGYTEARLDDLAAQFRRHARKTPPVPGIPSAILRHARFVEPVLVAEVRFRGWTGDGMVRQGSFKGLRGDKPAREVVREEPMPVKKASQHKAVAPQTKASVKVEVEADTIEGIHVTHPDRVLYQDQGVTKRELVDYYLAVADAMLPYVGGRPLALVRCPAGAGECFFQKHANPGWPDAFKKIRIREKSGADNYLYIEDPAGLVAAVQMNVLELHLWGARVDDVEKPDRMVFDFDPDPDLPFARVKDAAREMRERLADLGLASFPMATGGKGLHVVVPLERRHSWDEHRAFAEALARVMAEEAPDRFVANMSKEKRHGKIFIDYLRNQRGATAIAPYSTRARPGAHVAWPVSWEAMGRLKDAHPASVADAAKKLAKARNPWPDYDRVRQALPLKKLVK